MREYLARGEQTTDYARWAELFTDDAVYVEHSMGVLVGRQAIKRWIVGCMGQFAAATNWTEWFQIDGDRVAIYAWNNFPATVGSAGPVQFPSISLLRYAGDGMFVRQDDFYDAVASERLVGDWMANGGRHDLPRDMTLRGVEGWQPALPHASPPEDGALDPLRELVERESDAARTGEWFAWARCFTEDVTYRVEYDQVVRGRDAVAAWTPLSERHRPPWEVDLVSHNVVGHRVVARLSYSVEDATFDVVAILHYAGDGRWSYREDIYNPREIARAKSLLPPTESPSTE